MFPYILHVASQSDYLLRCFPSCDASSNLFIISFISFLVTSVQLCGWLSKFFLSLLICFFMSLPSCQSFFLSFSLSLLSLFLSLSSHHFLYPTFILSLSLLLFIFIFQSLSFSFSLIYSGLIFHMVSLSQTSHVTFSSLSDIPTCTDYQISLGRNMHNKFLYHLELNGMNDMSP